MTAAYEALRAQGYSFEEMAEANIDAMIRWKLPLANLAEFGIELEKRRAAWIFELEKGEPNIGPGSAYSRLMPFTGRLTRTQHLVDRYPAILEEAIGFAFG
ncbi:MAG: hypothetical protein ACXVII_45045, partial [Solirubrobacteraceae bacterium]